jgi:carboxymethylenebutenolidase
MTVTIEADGQERTGYLARPASGTGPGVLVLHAWWGLTPFFTGVCDRLAEAGFVAFAPDLHFGQTAATIPEAEALLQSQDEEAVTATAVAACDFLRGHEAVTCERLGAVGFSMGSTFALEVNVARPGALAAFVDFYGASYADLSEVPFAVLRHYGETDPYEPMEQVRRPQPARVVTQVYPGVGHWFFEESRPDAYAPEAAKLAWQRTVEFMRQNGSVGNGS